jgi:3',5'-cyclic AMP phosphodiesterase CpdA
MKVVAISDQHGVLPPIPPSDLLLIAGDVCPVINHAVEFQAQWLDTEFRRWLASLAHVRHVVGIAGNHDFIFERAPHLVPRDLAWVYLQDSLAEIEGLRVWGTPWQPRFGNWAFGGRPDELRAKWDLMPAALDVLVVHGPPLYYGDAVPRGGGVEHTGCPHLLRRIADIAPRLVVYGHIHEGRGQWEMGRTTLANVTLLDVGYDHVYHPWMFELGPP